jgi:hypothetical protein
MHFVQSECKSGHTIVPWARDGYFETPAVVY